MLSRIDSGRFQVCVSVPLILEYEHASRQILGQIGLTDADVGHILDYVCTVAHRQSIFYLWRPLLKDSNDDLVLELAVAAACDYIVTYNVKDFVGSERFGVKITTPKEFLEKIGVLP